MFFRNALRKIPPHEAIRQALINRCGSVRAAWEVIDVSGGGNVDARAFRDGLDRLKIPWKIITGFKRCLRLFRLFDRDEIGEISLRELEGAKVTVASTETMAWQQALDEKRRAQGLRKFVGLWNKLIIVFSFETKIQIISYSFS